MEKILFVINNLQIGGIQKSLVELLPLIENRYEITLYCINYDGEYKSLIPANVRIIKGNKWAMNPEQTLSVCRQQGLLSLLFHLFIKGWSQKFGRRFPARVVCLLSGRINETFDYAISYAQPSNSHYCISLTNEIVLYNIKSNQKYSYVHCDYTLYGGNTKYNHWLYSKFKKVAAVSESVKNQFINALPDMASRTIVVPNACNVSSIKQMASIDPIVYERTTILSVSRLGPEKGIMRCIPIIKRLVKDGFIFEWHIVGDGQERGAIEKEIILHNLQRQIKLEGMQPNPYRFMKNASCLFLPSFHEAAPMVFNEAACLAVPILSTNTLSAEEMVKDRKLGMVCDNNESAIYSMLKKFLEGGMDKCSVINERINDVALQSFIKLCSR